VISRVSPQDRCAKDCVSPGGFLKELWAGTGAPVVDYTLIQSATKELADAANRNPTHTADEELKALKAVQPREYDNDTKTGAIIAQRIAFLENQKAGNDKLIAQAHELANTNLAGAVAWNKSQ